MELWDLHTNTLEKGFATLRNTANYNLVTDAWWPTETCMVCSRTMRHPYYLGYVFNYHSDRECVRMIGAGYFCKDCEFESRVVVQILLEWGLLALDKAAWDEVMDGDSYALCPQVAVHTANPVQRDHKGTFSDVFALYFTQMVEKGQHYLH